MSGGVAIRAAVETDIGPLSEVASRSYADGFAAILDARSLAERTPAFFAARFAECWPRMQTAARDGRIVGFTVVTNFHIDMLFVDPAAYGGGVGTALLRAAEKAGARTLECFAENMKARGFYEHAGWRLTAAYERSFAGRVMRFVQYSAPVAQY